MHQLLGPPVARFSSCKKFWWHKITIEPAVVCSHLHFLILGKTFLHRAEFFDRNFIGPTLMSMSGSGMMAPNDWLIYIFEWFVDED